VLVAEFGVAGCYLLAALSTMPVVGALTRIPSPPPSRAIRKGMLSEVASGLAYIRADQMCVTLLAMLLVNSLFGMAYPAMMPVVARDVLGAGAAGYGALMAASGVGSLIGTLGVATFSRIRRPGLIAVGGSLAFGVTLIAFGFSTSLPLSLLLLALVGLAGSIYSTLISTMLQQSLDDDYRGRVMGVFSLVMNTMAFAGLQAGAVASAFGVSTALALNGVVVIAAGVFVLAFVPRIRSA
jgi:predicted MFS family arabinose efflux permease